LSGVIKHIDAPDWASMSKNSPGASDHWINDVFELNWWSLDTAKAYQSIVVLEPSSITHIFSIQNMYTTKHIGLDLSGVIKHIDAPDWASMSKNSH
jgi:hypothetical protein